MCPVITLKKDHSCCSRYFSFRLVNNGFKISRYQTSLSRYKMIKHLHDAGNKANKRRYGIVLPYNTTKGISMILFSERVCIGRSTVNSQLMHIE